MIRARCHIIHDGEPCDWLGGWRLDMQTAQDDGCDHVVVAHDYEEGTGPVTETRAGAAFRLEEG